MFQSQQKLGGYDLNTSPPLAKETHKHKLEYKYRGIVLKTLLIYNNEAVIHSVSLHFYFCSSSILKITVVSRINLIKVGIAVSQNKILQSSGFLLLKSYHKSKTDFLPQFVSDWWLIPRLQALNR